MRTATVSLGHILLALLICSRLSYALAQQPSPDAPKSLRAQPSVDEARRRAEILHEAMHATLQVVHLQYFREDEGVAIPAATLRSVFRELGRRQGVELRWLAVNAQAMNADHVAVSDFEKAAVAKLTAGADSHEQTENGTYRHVGAIVLESECLKCHEPNRNDVRPRTAGLLIAMPVAGE